MVFNNFSEEIFEGELVLLTGESGSGKTTLLRMLTRETEITSGHIYVLGEDVDSIPRKQLPIYRRKLGVVFQEAHLVEDINVYRNVELARLAVQSDINSAKLAVSSMLSMLGISQLHKKYPRQLSGGEKQKVCLARALVNYPSIILADEPTGNLSPKESQSVMQLFELVRRQGITVIVATHDKNSAEGLEYREITLGKEKFHGQHKCTGAAADSYTRNVRYSFGSG